MKKLQELFDHVIAWAKAGSKWRWIFAILVIAALSIPLSLLLFRKPVPASNADVDLKSTVEQEAIRQDVKSKNDQLNKDLQGKKEVIEDQSMNDSAQKVHDDTLREVLND